MIRSVGNCLLIVYLIIISKIIRMIISIIRLQVTAHTANLFKDINIPLYVVVQYRGVSTTYGGRESKFGFVSVFGAKNEVGIDKNISVGYKGGIELMVIPAFLSSQILLKFSVDKRKNFQ